jgi:hypothetical protein
LQLRHKCYQNRILRKNVACAAGQRFVFRWPYGRLNTNQVFQSGVATTLEDWDSRRAWPNEHCQIRIARRIVLADERAASASHRMLDTASLKNPLPSSLWQWHSLFLRVTIA